MRDCLSYFSLVILVFLALLGIVLVVVFLDWSGMLTKPLIVINGTPLATPNLSPVETLVGSVPSVEWSNPFENELPPVLPEVLPEVIPPFFSTPVPPTPTPLPTATPAPLAAPVYQAEVLVQIRAFGAALEAFRDANERLEADNSLIDDPAWRSEVSAVLDGVAAAGQALSAVGPPPPEYQPVAGWLAPVGDEALGLREDYLFALDTRNPDDFAAATAHLTRLGELLRGAYLEMLAAGWEIE